MNGCGNESEGKWKERVRKNHELARSQRDKEKQAIEEIIKDIDAVGLLCYFSLTSQFAPEDKPETSQDLRDKGLLHFLVGLCLKKQNLGSRPPNQQESERIIELLEEYFRHYLQELVLQSPRQELATEAGDLILSARLQKTITPINPSKYQFQLEDILEDLFSRFDTYFINRIGCTVSDALHFGRKIIKRYERLYNERVAEIREVRDKESQELKEALRQRQLQQVLERQDITETKAIELYLCYLMFRAPQNIFVFAPNEFCKEEEIKETDKFSKYLQALSCRFGEGSKDFDCPLDENIIISRPIINIDGGRYFSPAPQDLIFNLPLIFEGFLEDEKQNQTKTWQRYQRLKGQYTVDRVYDYFCRLFPKHKIFKNLKYRYKGEEFDVDTLLLYDNRIFIIESKSGSFTEAAKRGGLKRLKSDLKKLIGDAYEQGRRTRDYIQSTKTATFHDRKGRKVRRITKQDGTVFFLINVTLEPLMALATGLKRLRSLGLFPEDEYPWSVNLFELDLITRHISRPTIFIHYLERRLAAQDENVFRTYDELSLLAWYLEKGNFYIPVGEGERKPDLIVLTEDFVGMFDDHYLDGKKAPELKIERGLGEIISILEELHQPGHSNIASALLDFGHKEREFILKNMNELIEKTKKDGRKYEFTVAYRDILDTGFTFIAQSGRKGLTQRLVSFCELRKHQSKLNRWVGIGRDVSDNRWFANEFLYLKFPCESNAEMDALGEKFPLKKQNNSKKKQ